jgi:hypothetical protein
MPVRRFRVLDSVSLDDAVYTGQVLVTRSPAPKLTIAGWWMFFLLEKPANSLDNSDTYPTTSLLRSAYQATYNSEKISSLYKGFCVFFVAEAIGRGGKTMEAVVPQLYEADKSYTAARGDISIELLELPPKDLDDHRTWQRRSQRIVGCGLSNVGE